MNIKKDKKLPDGILISIILGTSRCKYKLFLLFSGGGSYDEGGEGIKIGRWIEVNDDFFDSS